MRNAGRNSATAACTMRRTTTSEAMESARSNPHTTMTTPAMSVPANP